MTREEQIQDWMNSTPVVRLCVNREVVELTAEEDRREYFERVYDEGISNYVEDRSAKERSAKRTALRQQWDSQPDFIRGPFRDKFEAANRLLDEGDDAAAVALIAHAEAPASFSAEELAVFANVKAAMKAGIESLA